ncbi:MAG: ATP-dependent helicase, partial [Bacteroidetes bacterium]|nr:ATP-dependent helicase [Bacteroidota bacterium]
PLVYDDYVHRVGRTGRANNKGIAITMANPAEVYHISKIEDLIDKKIPLKRLPGDIIVKSTPFDEQQLMAREIDKQRKKEDPSYKGAFHPKKKKLNRNAYKKRKR